MLRFEIDQPSRFSGLLFCVTCALACTSPTRNFVADGAAGEDGNGGSGVLPAGGRSSGNAGADSSGGSSTSTSSLGNAGVPASTGGAPSTSSAGVSGNAGTPAQVSTGGFAGGVAGTGGAAFGAGGSVASNGGATVAGMGGATVGGATVASMGGTSVAATGGATAQGGSGTGGAPPLLGNGRVCQNNAACQSANCRLAPNGSRYCVPAGSACATNAGNGLAIGGKYCEAIVSQACTANDSFSGSTCELTSACQVGICDVNSGSCGQAPANQGALCPSNAPTGACDAGSCLPLRFVPPTGSTWTYVPGGPATNVPSGCGTPNNPSCAIGDFRFVWPPDSGQKKCYSDSAEIACPGQPGSTNCGTTAFCGQDAQYGTDVTHPTWSAGRFVQSGAVGNDIVTDNVTGFNWTVSTATAMQMPWPDAQQFCNAKSSGAYGGLSNWSLPTVYQLFALYDFGLTATASSSFPGIAATYLWSSSIGASSADSAWYASMNVPPYVTGDSRNAPSSQSVFGVRCSAPGNDVAIATPRYYAEGVAAERAIFDSRTGLLWQQTYDATPRRWADILAYCQNIVYAGRSDWRAPNVLELESIVDYSRESPAIDPVVFPNTATDFFWSSTTVANSPSSAWAIRFLDGTLALWQAAKASSPPSVHPVRCVAGGPN